MAVPREGLPPNRGALYQAPNQSNQNKNLTDLTDLDPGPLNCPYCPKTCSSKSGLTRHLKTHSNPSSMASTSAQLPKIPQQVPTTEFAYTCPEEGCPQSFKTLRGLQVHRQAKHPAEYNAGISVTKEKARWNPQDRDYLANLEVGLIRANGGKVPANINLLLLDKFPARTFEALKSQRKRVEHQTKVRTLLDMDLNSSGNFSAMSDLTDSPIVPGESVSESRSGSQSSDRYGPQDREDQTELQRISIMDESRNHVREFLRNLNELNSDSDTSRHRTGGGRELKDVVELFLNNDPSYEANLQKFIATQFNSKQKRPPNIRRKRSPNVARVLTKRQQRRVEYAELQKRYNKNRARTANTVLEGTTTASSTINDAEFVKYWVGLTTQPKPPNLPTTPANYSNDLLEICHPITSEEARWGVSGPKKASGPDGVDLSDLRKLDDITLTRLLNLVFVCSTVPESLQLARTCFIPKEMDATTPNKFRPIAIGSYIQRILHKTCQANLQSGAIVGNSACLPAGGWNV